MDKSDKSSNFKKFANKTLFHIRVCNFREYTNEKTGQCEPCPKDSVAVDGPFSKNCVDMKTGEKLLKPVEVEEPKVEFPVKMTKLKNANKSTNTTQPETATKPETTSKREKSEI